MGSSQCSRASPIWSRAELTRRDCTVQCTKNHSVSLGDKYTKAETRIQRELKTATLAWLIYKGFSQAPRLLWQNDKKNAVSS